MHGKGNTIHLFDMVFELVMRAYPLEYLHLLVYLDSHRKRLLSIKTS